MPLVSVVMAVHNGDRYLAKAVESILQQTLTDFELIVIDDGSTDRSLTILQRYAAQDRRMRVISRENQGIPRTRNQLVAAASAEFVAVMDADDVALPDRLARQVEFLQQHPAVVCLGSAFALIDAKDRLLTELSVPLHNDEIQTQLLAGHAAVFQPCAMMRRSAVLRVHGYSEMMPQAEDLDLWLRLGEMGELANLPNCLVQYRIHADSMSEQACRLQRQKALEACQQAWQRRGIAGKFEAGDLWRPDGDRQSQHRFMLKYGWWAFASQQRRTALIYSLKAIQALPGQIEGWKLLWCALVKPFSAINSQ